MHMVECDGCGKTQQTDVWEMPKSWGHAHGAGLDLCPGCKRAVKAAILACVAKLRARKV